MSLYPGGRKEVSPGNFVYSLEDAAVASSMVQAIEQEMDAVYSAVQGRPLPATGKDDRRLLFTAIARGILKYLQNNEAGNLTAQDGGTHTHQVHLNINLNKS